MYSQKNILSQIDVVDALTSNNTKTPLSGNQGRILNSNLNGLKNSLPAPIEVSFNPALTSKLFNFFLGDVSWNSGLNQLEVTAGTGLTATTCTLINKTVTGDSTLVYGFSLPVGIGTFAIPILAGATHYFTPNGNSNVIFSLNEVQHSSLIRADYFTTASVLLGRLDLTLVASSPNHYILTGSFYSIPTQNVVSIRCETAVAQYTAGQAPFSFGDIENSLNAGIVMPQSGKLTQFTYHSSSVVTTQTIFQLSKNNILTPSVLIIPAGAVGGNVPISMEPLFFSEGDEITLVTVGGTPDVRSYDIVLMGHYET